MTMHYSEKEKKWLLDNCKAQYNAIQKIPDSPDTRHCTPVLLPATHRTFDTGATRDLDEDKLDFEGFLSPLVLEEFAKYMHTKRKMPDGSMRDSDNWQKGIPIDAYMKSMFRHFFAVWRSYRRGNLDEGYDYAPLVEELLALNFNVQGMTHEILKKGGKR